MKTVISTETRPRGKRLSYDERRAQLLLFGQSFFSQHAFDAVSVDEMARAAGVSPSLLYHYFGGRRGFYLATVRCVVDGALEAMRSAGGGNGDFVAVLNAFVAYCEEKSAIYKTVIRGGLGADPEVEIETDRVRHFVLGLAAKAVPPGAPPAVERIALWGWIAFVEVSVAQWFNEPSLTQAQFVDLLVGSLVSLAAHIGRQAQYE